MNIEQRKDLRGVNIQEEWRLILSPEELKQAVKKVAQHINQKFEGQEIVVVCILKGAVYFFVDFTRELVIPHSTYFIECSSYGDDQTQGQLEILSRIVPSKFQNKKVILIDELFDNGHTMNDCKYNIAKQANIPLDDIYTLALMKKKKTEDKLALDLYGILVPDVWLVGYGLDDRQEKRNWDSLWGCPKLAEIPHSPDDVIFESNEAYGLMREQLLKQIQE